MNHVWIEAAVVTVVLLLGGSYETWALRFHPDHTITGLIKRYTHLAIIVGGAAFMLFGYVLGVGGR